jgi:hypothetical protein
MLIRNLDCAKGVRALSCIKARNLDVVQGFHALSPEILISLKALLHFDQKFRFSKNIRARGRKSSEILILFKAFIHVSRISLFCERHSCISAGNHVFADSINAFWPEIIGILDFVKSIIVYWPDILILLKAFVHFRPGRLVTQINL